MSTARNPARLLGDVNAEADDLLDSAFYQSPDYKTLIEHPSSALVVGRRGAGKSALALMIARHWDRDNKVRIVRIFPTEEEIIGLRAAAQRLGNEYRHIRALFKILWRQALALEALTTLAPHYKLKDLPATKSLQETVDTWMQRGDSVTERLASLAKEQAGLGASTEEIIGGLAANLNWKSAKAHLETAISTTGQRVAIIIDRIDEGYQPDNTGTALVGGIASASMELEAAVEGAFAYVFLRDNIARAFAAQDPDYSRSMESRVLRLHWNEASLYNLTIVRLRAIYNTDAGQDRDLWNNFVSKELAGAAGFKKCLRYTLYRPRDVLTLLNQSYYNAFKQNNSRISEHDLEATAKTISTNRLHDLFREYEAICPSLEPLVRALADSSPKLSCEDLRNITSSVLSRDQFEPDTQQDLRIIETPAEAIRVLYEFGVIGAEDVTSGEFAFCHDGHQIGERLSDARQFLVHPCYWMTLGLAETTLDTEGRLEEIFDDYEISVFSHSAEERKAKLGKLAMQVRNITKGRDQSAEFEEWCHRAIQIAFAGNLRNVALHPNKQAPNRRDIVARNVGEEPVWKNLREQFHCFQVVFEVKNYEDIGADEIRQIYDYLSDPYGNIGFIICRRQGIELRKDDGLLERIREMWSQHKKLAIILDDTFLKKALEKARSPRRHDAPSILLEKVLDTYLRMYIAGQGAPSNRGSNRRKRGRT